MINRTVKKGKRKYRPGHGLGIWFNRHGYTLDYNIPAEAWYPPRQNAQGQNAEQWNKLGGVSFFSLFPWTWWPPNNRTALVGFRPAKVRGQFELSAYVNHSTKEWTVEKLLTVPADSPGKVEVVGGSKYWYYNNYHEGKEAGAEMAVNSMSFQFNIGPYFGGANKAQHTHSVQTNQA